MLVRQIMSMTEGVGYMPNHIPFSVDKISIVWMMCWWEANQYCCTLMLLVYIVMGYVVKVSTWLWITNERGLRTWTWFSIITSLFDYDLNSLERKKQMVTATTPAVVCSKDKQQEEDPDKMAIWMRWGLASMSPRICMEPVEKRDRERHWFAHLRPTSLSLSLSKLARKFPFLFPASHHRLCVWTEI